MKKIAIFGGAGLIGSYLVDLLVKKKYQILVVDNFKKGRKENIKFKKNVKFLNIDLEKKIKNKILYKYNEIIHLASNAYGVGYSKSNNLKILIHNERITNNIIDFYSNKQKLKYFMYASSSCVYDDNSKVPTGEINLFLKNPEMANYGYGWSKRLSEIKFQIFCKENNIKYQVIRPFNIYGERYNWLGQNSQAIPMLVNKIGSAKKNIIIWGSGSQKRNYIFGSDCAEIIYRIFKNRKYLTPVNIGYEDTITIRNLVLKIKKIFGKNKLNEIYDKSKPEGKKIKSSDSKLLKKITKNYKPKINIEDGLKKMKQWYEKEFI